MNERVVSDLSQRLNRMVIVGTVEELDGAAALVKVRFGPEAVSDWLPIVQLGSKDVSIWAPPMRGTQVIVLSPGGDTTKGLVMPGPYSGNAPDNRADAVRITMPGCDIDISGGEAKVTVATARFSGDVIVDGDVVAGGISLRNHIHGGVLPGAADTDKPS